MHSGNTGENGPIGPPGEPGINVDPNSHIIWGSINLSEPSWLVSRARNLSIFLLFGCQFTVRELKKILG